jgi:hypothetical protein
LSSGENNVAVVPVVIRSANIHDTASTCHEANTSLNGCSGLPIGLSASLQISAAI